MDFYTRVGMYFFTFGILLSVFAGAFPLSQEMENLVLLSVVFLGVFSAILNVTEDEETSFLVAASSFLIAIVAFKVLLSDQTLIIGLTGFFEAITFFVGSMVLVVALKSALEFASQAIPSDPISQANMIDEHMDRYLLSKNEQRWNFVVFIAVAMSFIVVLLDVFFTLPDFVKIYFLIVDVIITVIFVADLVVLYRKSEGFGDFVRTCWLDIIATIPFFLITQGLGNLEALRVLKIARLVRVMRFVKLNKTLKFMSERSGVKHYLHHQNTNARMNAEPDKEFVEKVTPKKKYNVATKSRSVKK